MALEPVKMTSHEVGQKTLPQLFEDTCCVVFKRILVHQAFTVPGGGGTETTISQHRTAGLQIKKHPGYGYILFNKGEYALVESSNVVVGYL